MRRVLLLAVVGLGVWAPGAVALSIDYTVSGTPGDAGWYRSAVTVTWTVDGAGPPNQCGATPIVLSFDTLGQTLSCSFIDGTGSHSAGTNPIKIDRTPPVASVGADRAADVGAVYTHPVTITWTGTDATSGIAACTSVPYTGPDGASISLTGTCTDKAGNVSAPLAFALNYDATPPTISGVSARPGDASAALSWQVSGAARIVVTRSPMATRGGGVVYDGTDAGFTDTGLTNGTRYTYTVSAVDVVGNAASTSVAVTPDPAASTKHLLSPGSASSLSRPPMLRWRKIARASYYNVQLFRHGKKILSAWPRKPQYQLRSVWTYRGHRHRLGKATYRWLLWAGYGHRSEHRYGKLLGKRSFTIR